MERSCSACEVDILHRPRLLFCINQQLVPALCLQAALARDAVDNLERLGPTFIKLGQIMSIR